MSDDGQSPFDQFPLDANNAGWPADDVPSGNGYELGAVAADDALVERLRHRDGDAGETDLVASLLLALALEVEADPAHEPIPLPRQVTEGAAATLAVTGHPESDRVETDDAGIRRLRPGTFRPVPRPGSVRPDARHPGVRRRMSLGIAAGAVAASFVGVSGVAAAVSGDVLAPYRTVVRTVTGIELPGEPAPSTPAAAGNRTSPSGHRTSPHSAPRLTPAEAASAVAEARTMIAKGDLSAAQTRLDQLHQLAESTPTAVAPELLAQIAQVQAALDAATGVTPTPVPSDGDTSDVPAEPTSVPPTGAPTDSGSPSDTPSGSPSDGTPTDGTPTDGTPTDGPTTGPSQPSGEPSGSTGGETGGETTAAPTTGGETTGAASTSSGSSGGSSSASPASGGSTPGASSTDAGSTDAGSTDAGSSDAGSTDTSSSDATSAAGDTGGSTGAGDVTTGSGEATSSGAPTGN